MMANAEILQETEKRRKTLAHIDAKAQTMQTRSV
jgi:hypothetical protein